MRNETGRLEELFLSLVESIQTNPFPFRCQARRDGMSATETLNAFLTIIRKEVIRFTGNLVTNTGLSSNHDCPIFCAHRCNYWFKNLEGWVGSLFWERMVPGMVMMSVINNAYLKFCLPSSVLNFKKV
ncbi:MAG: hypothetical protein Ct9H300mP20_03660 [Gammaproteobacteria bacterium]|nr:MAG: hypothetical protein Ct9H300mP20_03660 [Gammaproteobacteria bacterium]